MLEEPRDFPTRTPRSTTRDEPPTTRPRTGPIALLAGLAAFWWLAALGALLILALVWVFAY